LLETCIGFGVVAYRGRYVGALQDGTGVIVERLNPGPMQFAMPAGLTTPVPATPFREDTVMLSLYYRWALQVLSAMSFMHARSIYLKSFSSESVWLRSDYSLTITGFICATSPAIEDEFRRDAIVAINERKRNIAGQSGCIPILIDVDDKDAMVSPWFWDEGEWVGNGTFEYEEVLDKPCHNGSVEEDL
jgi:hypothetical protein